MKEYPYRSAVDAAKVLDMNPTKKNILVASDSVIA